MVPESISSDKIHGVVGSEAVVVGSEAVVEFEFTGVMGETCNCIMNHNTTKVSKPSLVQSHNQIKKHKMAPQERIHV